MHTACDPVAALKNLLWALLVGGLVVCLLTGCDQAPPQAPSAERVSDHQSHRFVQTPSESTYDGGRRLIKREVKHVRIFTPFGPAPGDTVAAQKPMTVSEGAAPGVNITPAGGIEVARGSPSEVSTGGFQRTLWDRIVSFFRSLKWYLIFGGIGLGVLWALPATRPIASAILRFFAWLVPVVGGIVEKIIAAIRERWASAQFQQVVDGGQTFKAAVKAMDALTPEQRLAVLDAFKASQGAAQDADTKASVAAAKVGT